MTRSFVFALSSLAVLALGGAALGQPSTVNVAGTYGCRSQTENGCMWSGQMFTVTQTGDALEVKNDKGEVGSGHVTSPITVSMGPPWNMFGVMHEAGTIDWSNGTQWKKQ
jgi:hypothetical protein